DDSQGARYQDVLKHGQPPRPCHAARFRSQSSTESQWHAAEPRLRGQIPLNVRRDLVSALEHEVVRSIGEDHQLGAREQLREPPPDRHGTDRVRVAPQEEHGNGDLAQPLGEVRTLATLVDEPPRHSGMPRPEAGAPVRGAQGCHVDAPDVTESTRWRTRLGFSSAARTAMTPPIDCASSATRPVMPRTTRATRSSIPPTPGSAGTPLNPGQATNRRAPGWRSFSLTGFQN